MTLIDPAGTELSIGEAGKAYSHVEAITSALSQAHEYWQMCITAARKAEAIGDIASRDKELADADRKAAQIDWYREQLALAAIPLTYPKIEAMEAAQ